MRLNVLDLDLMTVLNFVFSCFMVFVVAVSSVTLYMGWMKKKIEREDEYDERYKSIQDHIKSWTTELDLCDTVFKEYYTLIGLPYKNPEKSRVLFDEITKKKRLVEFEKVNIQRKQPATPCQASYLHELN